MGDGGGAAALEVSVGPRICAAVGAHADTQGPLPQKRTASRISDLHVSLTYTVVTSLYVLLSRQVIRSFEAAAAVGSEEAACPSPWQQDLHDALARLASSQAAPAAGGGGGGTTTSTPSLKPPGLEAIEPLLRKCAPGATKRASSTAGSEQHRAATTTQQQQEQELVSNGRSSGAAAAAVTWCQHVTVGTDRGS